MFKKLLVLSLVASCSLTAQVLLSDFGTAQGITTTVGGPSTTFTFRAAGGFALSDVTSTGGITSFVGPGAVSGSTATSNNYSGTLPNITGTDRLILTAKIDAGNGANVGFTGFRVNVFSSATESVSADFLFSSFNSSTFTSVTSLFNAPTAGFNPAALLRFSFAGGVPTGSDAWRMSFDSLVAASPVVVPEPSTYASIAGIFVLGFVAVRRRKVSV